MATIMNKIKYIRTSSGSMMPVYPHPTDKKESLKKKKTGSEDKNLQQRNPK